MKGYVLLLYNPKSGSKGFASKLDYFIEKFQEKEYDVMIHRTTSGDDFYTYLRDANLRNCKAIIVAGGDGSINKVVNCLIKESINIPLGIIPAGTANDLAKHLGLPTNLLDAIDSNAKMFTQDIDVGKVNNDYFINVCSGGLFTNISSQIDIDFKNTFGKLAYYIKALQQIPNLKSLKFKIQYDDHIIEDYFYLFLALNGSSAGGFNSIAKNASLTDGYMDFIGIKQCPINYIPILLGKIIGGDHFDDSYVEFFQCEKVVIDCIEGDEIFYESDIDGEIGPRFPLEITVLHKTLEIICPEE